MAATEMIGDRRGTVFLFLLLVAIAGAALYIPFLSNGLVFDDHGFFANLSIYDNAVKPFNFRPRTFPYFTLGFIQVLYGNLEANRIFSLVIHLACCYTLFFLLISLLEQAKKVMMPAPKRAGSPPVEICILAAFGAMWFAIHPIAVYGAAYLAQRTILFATLFSLLSLWFYQRAFVRNHISDVFLAALCYSMAVFSKEHAVMLPLSTVALTTLNNGSFRSHWKKISIYLAACLPAALTVIFMTRHIVATSYEPDVAVMIQSMQQAIQIMSQSWGQWLVSIVMQAALFFVYIALWIVPDITLLSADMRFDFVHIWFSWWSFPTAVFFLLSPIVAIYFVRKKGLVALFCCGFLYSWLLFLTELAAVRFQEPFVLYRSYIWAPGYAMMLVAGCACLRRRWLVVSAVPILIVFLFLARERLFSFESDATLWKDAASKLTSLSVLGSDRIFYNRGNAYLAEKNYFDAIIDYSYAISNNPNFAQAYYNRALAYVGVDKYPESRADVEKALMLDPLNAQAHYTLGFLLERQGNLVGAHHEYVKSADMGNWMAKFQLNRTIKKTHNMDKGGTINGMRHIEHIEGTIN